MKAWKKRSRRFEGFYKQGRLQKTFVNTIIIKDGTKVYKNWLQYCKDSFGDIKQEFMNDKS